MGRTTVGFVLGVTVGSTGTSFSHHTYEVVVIAVVSQQQQQRSSRCGSSRGSVLADSVGGVSLTNCTETLKMLEQRELI